MPCCTFLADHISFERAFLHVRVDQRRAGAASMHLPPLEQGSLLDFNQCTSI